ncbi:unnamed protein product [Anisakis simplex]|uniref:Prephenate dehydrogenase n=1 Tax=Anisakis simplex TaxID=6269 RepID=A0A0M3JGW1_ANISI|nr:unnamed protein product [Anisakis simplex]
MTASEGRPPGGSALVWLEALEKDFDKAFVDLDLLLGEIDSDQVEHSLTHPLITHHPLL